MRRYIVLLLITGIVWAQTDFDKLVLKDGTTYLGEYYNIKGEIVYFKPQHAFAFQPIGISRVKFWLTGTISINKIKILQLKDGQFIILDGKDILAYEEYQKNSLEEYQKLSTEEKAIYDANLYNVKKWALYGPMSTILFGGCVLLKDYFNKKQGLKKDMIRLESPIFLGGSLAASLTIPYFVFNRKEKINFPKSILTDSEKEIYKQTYSKKLMQRKFRYAAVSTTVSVVIVAVAVASFDLDMSGGFGGGGDWGIGGYSGP